MICTCFFIYLAMQYEIIILLKSSIDYIEQFKDLLKNLYNYINKYHSIKNSKIVTVVALAEICVAETKQLALESSSP